MSWPTSIAQAWLVAISAGLGLPLGALVLLMIHQLTGGLWGEEAKPALRRIAGLLPVLLLCGLPLLGAIELLLPFVTALPDTLPARVVGKLAYLQPIWIIARTALVAAMWLAAWLLHDRSRRRAVIGLVLYGVGLTIFTTDWMQALDPEFYSTIYPVEVAGAQILGALALTILMVPIDVRGDFGKILLSVVLSWSYFAAMQWVIVWMGDLPPEAAWYLQRTAGAGSLVLLGMLMLIAIVPFFALLPRAVRSNLPRLRIVAGLTLGGYLLEDVWRLAIGGPLTVLAMLVIAALFYLLLRPRAQMVAHHA